MEKPTRPIGIILIVATALLLFTALTHPPSGEALLTSDGIKNVDTLWYLAHIVGVGVWVLFISGFALLQKQLASRGETIWSMIGLLAMAFAGGSAFISGIFGGFVRPQLANMLLAAAPDKQAVLHSVYEYNTMVNNMFANAYQVAFALTIVLFSVSFLRLGLGKPMFNWAGIIGGAAIALGFISGHLVVQSSNFHVFVAVNLLSAAWTLALGILIARGRLLPLRSLSS